MMLHFSETCECTWRPTLLEPPLDLPSTFFRARDGCVHLKVIQAMGMNHSELCLRLPRCSASAFSFSLLQHFEWTTDADQEGWQVGKEACTFLYPLRFHKHVVGNNEVVDIRGGGAVGDQFRQLLNLDSDDPAARARRNLAELGIGANPNARRPDNILEAEKIRGTLHIGIGDNAHMGGQVESDLHDDLVQPQPDLLLDGKPVIVAGEWKL